MNLREKAIFEYFNSWITKDSSKFDALLSQNIIYSECYGPEYHGISEIKKWFSDWNRRSSVLQWEIKQFIHSDKTTVAEWYFECKFEGKINGFDGVSLIEFDKDNKIKSVKEFQSKAEHYCPYSI